MRRPVKGSHAAEFVVIASLLALAASSGAAAEKPQSHDIGKGENLALRKPYTLSVWPTVKSWLYEQRGAPLPDTDRLLTDGKLAKTESFALDHEAVVFGDATTLEIVVDLGETRPIGEIWARHESNAHRSVQPLKQEYYVSEDGETFYKAAERKNTWDPPELTDRSQLAQAMLTFDRAWREASRELGRPGTACYVPAIPPHIDFTPESEKFKIRGASEYLHQLNALTMWGVPFAIKLGRVHLPSLVGHNLVSLDEIRNAVTMVSRQGRREAGRRHPRVYNMSGIQFGVTSEGKFVMPRVFYFQTVLDALEGLDGHASYREYGVDARFMRLRAKAARFMATYESFTLHGTPKANFAAAIASPVPRIPGRSVLYAKSYKYEGSQIVALGNDGIDRIYVALSLTDLESGGPIWLVDRMASTVFGGADGYDVSELKRGVLIDIPPKEFRILEVHRELTDPAFRTFAAVDDAEVRGKLEAEKNDLAESAKRLESLP